MISWAASSFSRPCRISRRPKNYADLNLLFPPEMWMPMDGWIWSNSRLSHSTLPCRTTQIWVDFWRPLQSR